jgi:hypothetical protein
VVVVEAVSERVYVAEVGLATSTYAPPFVESQTSYFAMPDPESPPDQVSLIGTVEPMVEVNDAAATGADAVGSVVSTRTLDDGADGAPVPTPFVAVTVTV